MIWLGESQVFYSTMKDGKILTPINISKYTVSNDDPKMVVDAEGEPYFLWEGYYIHDRDTYFSSREIALQSGSSTISQEITIPITMTHPTLSFYDQLIGTSLSENMGLSVDIDDGISHTTVLSKTTDTHWEHHWFDLSTWSGKTVQLSFSTHQVSGAYYVSAYIDEVTLGDSHPDVWIAASATASTFPGNIITYQISYGNRGPVPVQGLLITDTLPLELTFINSSLPPIVSGQTLTWEIGDLPAVSGPFSITLTVMLDGVVPLGSLIINPVVISKDINELETLNNITQPGTYIGASIFLPALLR